MRGVVDEVVYGENGEKISGIKIDLFLSDTYKKGRTGLFHSRNYHLNWRLSTMLSKKRKRKIFFKTISGSYTFVFGLYSFLTIFIPVSSVFSDYEKNSWFFKIVIAILFAFAPFVLGVVVVCGLFWYYNRKTSCQYSMNGDGYHMVVEYGDFKDIMFPKRIPQRKYAVIIPVHNRVGEIFDYKESYGQSIHGMWLKGVPGNYLDKLSKRHKDDLRKRFPKAKLEEIQEPIGKGIFVPGNEVGVENVNYYFLFSNECLRDGRERLTFVKAVSSSWKYSCP